MCCLQVAGVDMEMVLTTAMEVTAAEVVVVSRKSWQV